MEFLGSIVAKGQIRKGDDRVVQIIIIIVKNSG